jgi:NADH:ubiquinone oxidoreductase subunit E
MSFSLMGPPRPPPTHKAMDLARLTSLAMDLEEHAQDGFLTHDALETFASEQGIPIKEAYAAAAYNPSLRFELREDVQLVVCVGGCQQWGALDVVDHALTERERRAAADETSYDVVTRSCLNACDHAPMIALQTPHGATGMPKATRDKVNQALRTVLDE